MFSVSSASTAILLHGFPCLFTLFITTKILLLSFKIRSWSVPLSEVLRVFSRHINYPVSSFRPTLLHCECLLYYLKFLLQISTWVHGWLLIDCTDILFLWNSIFILGETISWSNESACRKERWKISFVHPYMDYAVVIQGALKVQCYGNMNMAYSKFLAAISSCY